MSRPYNRFAMPPPATVSRDSYMSNISTDSSQSTVLTDLWDNDEPYHSRGSPRKTAAGWRTSQIGSQKNYGYGASARPFYKRASTNVTIPDEPAEKKDGLLGLNDVEEISEEGDAEPIVSKMTELLEEDEEVEADAQSDETITFDGTQTGSVAVLSPRISLRKPLFGTTSWQTGYPTSPKQNQEKPDRPTSLFYQPPTPNISSPLPDRHSLDMTPRLGSRTSHIAATLDALESKSSVNTPERLPLTPTTPRTAKRISSKIESISREAIRSTGNNEGSTGMKASPSLMALKSRGGIKSRISMIEQNAEDLPATDAFKITHAPKQSSSVGSHASGSTTRSPSQNRRIPSMETLRRVDTAASRRTARSAMSRAGASSFADFEREGTSDVINVEGSSTVDAHESSEHGASHAVSPVETFESFRVESFYGAESRGDAAIGDLKERIGDVRVGSLVTTSSGNLIHLPAISPLNIRRPLSTISRSTWTSERDESRTRAVHALESDVPELSEMGTRSSQEGPSLTTPIFPEQDEPVLTMPTTPERSEGEATVSPSHFSTSKRLGRNRVPPPQLTPKTASTSVFRAPSTKNPRTAAWISRNLSEAEPEDENRSPVGALSSTGHAKAMINRFESGTPAQSAIDVETKSLPVTPIKRSARQIGLGTPPVRGSQTDKRIGSGRNGMRGELSSSYPGNRDKPLPAIYPYQAPSNATLQPPPRTWTADEIVIPVSPPRTQGKSASNYSFAQSPLKDSKGKSKSPLKGFIGKIHDVRNKVKVEVGRRRAGTLDKEQKWNVPAYRAVPHTDPIEDVFGTALPVEGNREQEAQHGLGQYVGVAQSVLASSVAGSENRPQPRDRMGDAEMRNSIAEPSSPPSFLRQSTGYFLMPPPCSTDSHAGTWTPAEITLSAGKLEVSPFSGCAAQWAIGECLNIRPFNARDAMEQGIPSATASDGTAAEVIELEFENTVKRYLGVDGVADRLGWIAALWDAMISARRAPRDSTAPQPIFEESKTFSPVCTPFSMGLQSSGPLFIRNRDATPNSVSTFRIASNTTSKASPRLESGLRHSVQGMFAEPEDMSQPIATASWTDEGRHEQLMARTRDEVPAERELSIFSRSRSLARARSMRGFQMDSSIAADDRSEGLPSFDESDLNPSRSASQRAAPLREELVTIQDIPRRIESIRQGPGRRLPQPKMPNLLGPRPVRTGSVEPGYFDIVNSGPVSVAPAMERGERDFATGAITPPRLPTEAALPLQRSTSSDDDIRTILPDESSTPWVDERPAHKACSSPTSELLASSPLETNLKSPPSEEITSVAAPHGRFSPEHSDESLLAQLEAVRAEARLAFTQSKLLQEQTDAIQNQAEAVRALSPLIGKVDAAHLDIKEIQNTLQIAALAALKEGEAPTVDLEAVHSKLDRLIVALQSLPVTNTAVPNTLATVAEPSPPATSASAPAATGPSEPPTKDPASPKLIPESAGTQSQLLDQVQEVLASVREMQVARQAQNQQSADMAKYLGQLNGWLEQFVIGSTKELQTVAGKLDRLVTELAPEPAVPTDGASTAPSTAPGVAGLVNQVHGMMVEQKQRTDEDASTAQRVDNLLKTMVEDRNSWTASLDTVRQENESLLRAMATDLTSEIRGERLRFVEAMREATSVNVSLHIEEFKNMLNTEVARNMQELTQMQEQKRTLELQLSDYFALMAKTNKGGDSGAPKATATARTPFKNPLPLPPTSPMPA